jgi:hypothetical protein
LRWTLGRFTSIRWCFFEPALEPWSSVPIMSEV